MHPFCSSSWLTDERAQSMNKIIRCAWCDTSHRMRVGIVRRMYVHRTVGGDKCKGSDRTEADHEEKRRYGVNDTHTDP